MAMPKIPKENELSNEEVLNDESSRKSELTKEVDQLHVETILSLRYSVKAAENTFKVNFYVNVVIIVLGILLILIAIVQSAVQGINPFSITFGSLGVANFVAVFLLNPQSRLQQNLCRLSQMNVILSNFLYEYDNFLIVTRDISDVNKLVEINKEGERIISFTLKSMNELLSTFQKKNESE